jgi:benzoyl-CoA reductase subunit C
VTPAPLGDLLARAERLAGDLALASVREWKAKTGGLAVGYTPVYAPVEVLHAMGILPVSLRGAGDELEIIRGDAYYQSYICHIPRSTLERGLNGSLDLLDGVLFPAICDVMRNLSGMWKALFPKVLVRFLEWPQDPYPGMGGAFWRREIESLAEDLAARGARPLETEALRASIAIHDEHRALVESLHDLRRARPWTAPTSELHLLLRAGAAIPVEEHLSLLSEWRDAILADGTRRPRDQARVVLQGSFCEAPPLGLLRTLERAGCYVVEDDIAAGQRWIRGPVGTQGDPLGNLVEAFLSRSSESPIRWEERRPKGDDLVERVRRSNAEGVLFCAPSFCDPALLDQPMAAAALDRAGIPWTAFRYAENGGQFQSIREQAGTFSDSLRLWGAA